MRICFLANPTWSHVIRWSRFMVNAGHELHIIYDDHGELVTDLPKEVALHPITLAHSALALPWIVRYTLILRRIMRSIRPDLVHVHNCDINAYACLLLRIKPLVVSVYGMDVVRYGGPEGERRSSAKTYGMKRQILRKARCVTAPSRFLAEAAARYAGIDPSQIALIPFGVDTGYWLSESGSDPDSRKEALAPETSAAGIAPVCESHAPEGAGSNQQKFTFAVLKDLRPEYEFEHFIDAIDILRRQTNGFRVRIGGDGIDRDRLESLVRNKLLESIVSFENAIPLSQARGFLDVADVVVMPSVFESFGVVALEAQSLRKPVIAVDTGGVKEVIQDGTTGLLVPARHAPAMAAAMLTLKQSEEKRRRFGQAGRRFVQEHFEWVLQAGRMLEVYKRLVP